MALSLRISRYKRLVLQSEDTLEITDEGRGVYNLPVTVYSDEDEIRLVILDGSGAQYSEIKSIIVGDSCSNPVTLQWIDTTGGRSCHTFQVNQEYTFTYENGKKAKRLRLYADHLTLNQWEGINGLNTLGEIYKNSNVEWSATVNKTHSRIGQQVYATDADDNTVGVIVIPTENSTFTKQVKHSIEITIEYPEIILQ